MRVGGKLFRRRAAKRRAWLRGMTLALGFCALAFIVGAATHQRAMASTGPSAVSRIDGAFSALSAVAPRNAESSPQANQIDCSDFTVAFINATCFKVWRKHTSVKRHHPTTIRSAMLSIGRRE